MGIALLNIGKMVCGFGSGYHLEHCRLQFRYDELQQSHIVPNCSQLATHGWLLTAGFSASCAADCHCTASCAASCTTGCLVRCLPSSSAWHARAGSTSCPQLDNCLLYGCMHCKFWHDEWAYFQSLCTHGKELYTSFKVTCQIVLFHISELILLKECAFWNTVLFKVPIARCERVARHDSLLPCYSYLW